MNGLMVVCPPCPGCPGCVNNGERDLPSTVRTLSKPSPPLSDHHNPGRKGMPQPTSRGGRRLLGECHGMDAVC